MIPRARLVAAAAAALFSIALACVWYLEVGRSRVAILGEPPGAPISGQSLAVNPQAQPNVPEPEEQPRPYSNEDLHDFLTKDQQRMGISKIYSKDEMRARKPNESPEKQRQMEEARAKVRAMTAEIKAALEARKIPPAVLNGDKVSLLSAPEDAYSARGAPLGGDQPAVTFRAQGTVLRSQEEINGMWDALKSSLPRPQVDFSQNMVVIVVSDPDAGHGITISKVRRAGGKVIVGYSDSLPGEPGGYYEFQILAKTDDPVVFEKINSSEEKAQK